MSKKSKAASQEKRKKEKSARKAAKRALYESYRDKGINSKSKRARKNAEVQVGAKPRNHSNGICGNPGCRKCYGINYSAFMFSDGRFKPGTPHWVYKGFTQGDYLEPEDRQAA